MNIVIIMSLIQLIVIVLLYNKYRKLKTDNEILKDKLK